MTHSIESGGGAPPQRLRSAATPEYFLVAVLAALYLSIFVRVQWRIGDEGDIINGALAVSEGRVPYRDFFDLRGPASFYWLGLFFKIFGATWRVARVHLLLTGAMTALLVFHLTRRACRGVGALLPCALVTALSIPLWAAPHHHWDSNLFALAAVSSFCYSQDHGRAPWLFVSGALAGVTSCFMYQKGFLLLVSFLGIVSIWRRYFQGPLTFIDGARTILAGYAAVGLIVIGWFWHLGAIQDIFVDTVRLPLTTYADANRLPYAHHLTAHALGGLAPSTRPPLLWSVPYGLALMTPFLLVAGLPFLVVSIAGARLFSGPINTLAQLPLITYTMTGFALWFSEFHRRDMMHLIYGCPLLLVALWLLWEGVDRPRLARRLVPSLVAGALLVLIVSRGSVAAAAGEHVATRRGDIVLPQDDHALRFLLSEQVARGDYVFVYPYYPTYYFLADVKNPTRFGVMMYGPGSKPYFDEAIASIEANKVKYILWDTVIAGDNLREWLPAYRHPPPEQQWMELYFQEHYEQQGGLLNGFRLLRRRTK